jgi:hypothetical protein
MLIGDPYWSAPSITAQLVRIRYLWSLWSWEGPRSGHQWILQLHCLHRNLDVSLLPRSMGHVRVARSHPFDTHINSKCFLPAPTYYFCHTTTSHPPCARDSMSPVFDHSLVHPRGFLNQRPRPLLKTVLGVIRTWIPYLHTSGRGQCSTI